VDGDVAEARNISRKRLARLASSQGVAGKEMKESPTISVVLRVDAGELSLLSKT
jgi:hypothetical protein